MLHFQSCDQQGSPACGVSSASSEVCFGLDEYRSSFVLVWQILGFCVQVTSIRPDVWAVDMWRSITRAPSVNHWRAKGESCHHSLARRPMSSAADKADPHHCDDVSVMRGHLTLLILCQVTWPWCPRRAHTRQRPAQVSHRLHFKFCELHFNG